MGTNNNRPFQRALRQLAQWFSEKQRILPWRDRPDFYRVWISEIMLQQTQVVTVIPYFEKFIARFPSVETLASAAEDEVMLYWAGLGYYSRARNLHKAAKQIVVSGGAADGFPKDREGWEAIPGVGPYTAGAILSIAGGQPEAILDGNVERVLSRVRRVNRRTETSYKARLWSLSRIFVEKSHSDGISPSVLNQALMELGATICTPRKPKCEVCPASGVCRAFQAGDAEAYPPRKKPKEWVQIREELHCVLDDRGRVLLRRRSQGEWRAGLWDLLDRKPEGKLISLGIVETKHVVTRHKISRKTHVWKVTRAWGAAESSDDLRWVSPSQPEVAVGAAVRSVLGAIEERLL